MASIPERPPTAARMARMDYTARMTRRPRIPLIEAMGLRPLGVRYRQALVALRGEEDVPKSQMGLSSLKLLRPNMT